MKFFAGGACGQMVVTRYKRTAFTSSSHTIEVVQRYQLNHSHENAQRNEARAEDSLAIGRACAHPACVASARNDHEERQPGNDPDLAPEALISPCCHALSVIHECHRQSTFGVYGS